MSKSCLNKPVGDHLYKIPWQPGGTSLNDWSDVVIQLVDQFGLPGDRYYTDITPDSLDIHFESSDDLIWFTLLKKN